MYSEPKFLPAGDQAVSVEFGDAIGPEVNTRVRALEYLIQQKAIPGIVETVPTFRALLVYYDPIVIGWNELLAILTALIPQAQAEALPPSRLVEIPCCYGGELGFDLQAVGEKLGLSPEQVVSRHSAEEYLVYFIGFTPGLPYMVGMSDPLTIPRLDKPRTKTPAGSVGIGGTQCCIYPVESPGGFWILGRTPLALYDPSRSDPILLRPGDRVRFRPIDPGEFERISAEVAAGCFVARVET
ncbi:MAG: 5-oxoprolinase subunit PxpB [Candidatus Rokubacteria bacterium]|nr:5-oxoprolinase subunit PxpB [Candidatus Rokubacteria bacterium]